MKGKSMQPIDRWLDEQVAPSIKSLDEGMRQLIRSWRDVKKSFQAGDFTRLSELLGQIDDTMEHIPQATSKLATVIGLYDVKAYLENTFDGDFRKACESAELPVEGKFPRYFVNPVVVQVQVDVRNPGALINQRRHRGLRISNLIEAIKTERNKLIKRPFNARQFLEALAIQYDELVELESAKSAVQLAGKDVSLRSIYRRLTPMRQWRNQYPERFFAYDLHRLLVTDEKQVSDGRRMHLAPANVAKNNLSVRDPFGQEVQYGLISFRME